MKKMHTFAYGSVAEPLESRRLLSAAIAGNHASLGVALDVDVTAARSASTSAAWRDTGALRRAALPAGSSVSASVGRLFDFTRATFARSLPARISAAARDVLLPTPLGGFARFVVSETALLAPNIAKAHPDIHTYRAIGVDDPSAVAQFDLTENGFHATVLSPLGAWTIAPVTEYSAGVRAGAGQYASYFLAHDPIAEGDLLCEVTAEPEHGSSGTAPAQISTGPTRATMRIAVAGTGEWTATAGGTQSSGLATIVTAVNTADAVYRRDVNVGFTLVSGTNLVYTDGATDPYSNTDASAQLVQNQTNVDTVIGNANYDIGHVFCTASSGVANLGVVGETNFKARGVSGNPATSSNFPIRFMHEMGHQFNGGHTWNDISTSVDSGRSSSSAYEPGPGSTILSYGGLGWAGNFVTIRDTYFHAKSIDSITTYVASDSNGVAAGTRTATGNDTPTANAGVNRTIPANTSFELTGSGTDSSALTYTWEQYDLGNEQAIGIDDGNGPLFRSRPATTSPTRMFPELADVLANRSDADERLPSVARSTDPLTFRLTVRDGLGGQNFDDVDVVVVNTGAAFAITSQNSAGTNWAKGTTQTITWDVAGTTAAPISASLVTLYISYDGGATFTPVLAGTANDGSADIVVPIGATTTSTARIKIQADNNIFFDINNAAITISVPVTPNGVWDGGGDGTNWSSAGNWSNDVLPGAADDVVINIAANPTVVLAGGSVSVRSVTSAENLSINGGSLSVSQASSISGSFTLAGGTLTGAGAMTLNNASNTWSSGAIGGSGKLAIAAGATLNMTAAGAVTQQSLRQFEINGTVNSPASGSRTTKLASLSILGNGKLDLFNNDLIVTGTAKSTIEGYVKTAYNFGNWLGASGIFSTTAKNNAAANTTLGLLSGTEFASNNGGQFNGNVVTGTDVLVKYTYFGDVDFNGTVDVSDYNLIDFGFANGLTGWGFGDADYSGATDVSDYNLIDFAFATQSGAL